jgi:homoserine O-succinyltransferase
MTKVADWARGHTASTIWSCLAAHAAVLYADGVERGALNQKLFGVFECRLGADHPMTRDFPEPQWIPHSRYNGLPERELAACGYKVLTRSAIAGVDSFAKQDGSFFLFFQGHPEYDADTLLREYRRDIACFLAGERADYPAMPLGYFDRGATSVANGFRARAMLGRRGDLIADFPKNILEAGVKCPWRSAAIGLYQRWAAYLTAHKAERRNATVPRRRTWRDWPIGRAAAGSR